MWGNEANRARRRLTDTLTIMARFVIEEAEAIFGRPGEAAVHLNRVAQSEPLPVTAKQAQPNREPACSASARLFI